jgi:hypothetical protein
MAPGMAKKVPRISMPFYFKPQYFKPQVVCSLVRACWLD